MENKSDFRGGQLNVGACPGGAQRLTLHYLRNERQSVEKYEKILQIIVLTSCNDADFFVQ